VPYTDEEIADAQSDLVMQASASADPAELQKRYPKAQVRDFDGNPNRVTEMDALVAYLQMLGTLVDFNSYNASENAR
jgi:cytochrome c oxidase cbb3-type subunit 2